MIIHKIIKRIRYYRWKFDDYYWRISVPKILKEQGLVFQNCRFYGLPIIEKHEKSVIELSPNVVLCSVSTHTALGVNHPVILRTLREDAQIRVGENSGLSGTSICAMKSVSIGRNCLIGANVTIADTNFHSLKIENRRFNNNSEEIDSFPIVIEDNVFIGTGCLILKGVTIGENSVVGAGSVVTRSIPANKIAAGNPARIIGEI